MALILDVSELTQAGARKPTAHDNCIVLDLGTGSFPRDIEVRLPDDDGARQNALWDGSLNLDVNDEVLCFEYSGITAWRVMAMGGNDGGAGKARVSEVWESDFGDVALETDASGNVTINGTRTLTIPTDLIHAGDPDNKFSFADDKISLTVGGLLMLEATEVAGQDTLDLGDVAGGGDVDISFNNGQMSLQGSSGNLGIGMGATAPDARVAIVLGAGGGILSSDILTDATLKQNRFLLRHYTNAEEDIAFFGGVANITENQIRFGGGYGLNNAATLLRFFTAANNTTLTGTERLRIDSNGRVGINTADPDSLLVAVGETFIGPAAASGNTSNSHVTLGLTINQEANDDNIFELKSSDIVHGMTDLTETDTFFYIRKSVGSTGGATMFGLGENTIGFLNFGVAVNDTTSKDTASAGYIEFRAAKKSGTGVTTAGTNANLVVFRNNTSTRFIFDAEGTGHADDSWVTFSDRRLKTEIENIPYGLKELMLLRPKRFVKQSGAFNNGKVELSGSGRRKIGLIAQDIKSVIPEAVKDIDSEVTSFYSLDYDSLSALLISAVQELKLEIDELRHTYGII